MYAVHTAQNVRAMFLPNTLNMGNLEKEPAYFPEKADSMLHFQLMCFHSGPVAHSPLFELF